MVECPSSPTTLQPSDSSLRRGQRSRFFLLFSVSTFICNVPLDDTTLFCAHEEEFQDPLARGAEIVVGRPAGRAAPPATDRALPQILDGIASAAEVAEVAGETAAVSHRLFALRPEPWNLSLQVLEEVTYLLFLGPVLLRTLSPGQQDVPPGHQGCPLPPALSP